MMILGSGQDSRVNGIQRSTALILIEAFYSLILRKVTIMVVHRFEHEEGSAILVSNFQIYS